MEIKSIDKKDLKILRVLNEDFRYPFSVIASKVGLSKNSVRLRFERLKELMLHNTVGINNRILGFTLVKVFYFIDSLDSSIENKIINELKKHKHVVYAARLYGHYNIEVALFVRDFEDFIEQITLFDSRFSRYISEKVIEIVSEEYFFRDNFLFDTPCSKPRAIIKRRPIQKINNSDKKILFILRQDPRKSILDIFKKTNLSPKTVINRMKYLKSSGVITGYFMMLDYSKFNLGTFKLLIQTNNISNEEELETFLSSLNSIKHFSKMIGIWDYEVDALYSSVSELQKDIEFIKLKFPRQIKKIEIINHGKRIVTNRERFLIESTKQLLNQKHKK